MRVYETGASKEIAEYGFNAVFGTFQCCGLIVLWANSIWNSDYAFDFTFSSTLIAHRLEQPAF